MRSAISFRSTSLFFYLILSLVISLPLHLEAQARWVNVDVDFAPLPEDFHVFKTTDSLDGKPFIAFYAIAFLKNKNLQFSTDTTLQRRLTPVEFYKKNAQPLLVVNTTFFSFATSQNLNLVIKDEKVVSYNTHSIALKGKDTLLYKHPFASAIGISKKRKADVAWTFTDSSSRNSFALQNVHTPVMDSVATLSLKNAERYSSKIFRAGQSGIKYKPVLKKWKMHTAVGGGPVLVHDGQIKITNNEELKFAGRAMYDKHPRTLIGYTKNDQLIVMVIEGRHTGTAEGANLQQAAKIMVDLGCIEALNLDGGGSSCMLINGKNTIEPSDKGLQRAVPAVFIIKNKLK